MSLNARLACIVNGASSCELQLLWIPVPVREPVDSWMLLEIALCVLIDKHFHCVSYPRGGYNNHGKWKTKQLLLPIQWLVTDPPFQKCDFTDQWSICNHNHSSSPWYSFTVCVWAKGCGGEGDITMSWLCRHGYVGLNWDLVWGAVHLIHNSYKHPEIVNPPPSIS